MKKVVYELRSVPNQVAYDSVYCTNFPYRNHASQRIYEMANKVAQASRLESVYNVRDYSHYELKDTML